MATGTIYARFCIARNTDTFNSVADYSVDRNYSCPVKQPPIEHLEDPVTIPEDRSPNCCERAVLSEILDRAKASYPDIDGWLIIADCPSESIEGIELNGVELVSAIQYATDPDGYPSFDLLESLTEDFRGLRSIHALAAVITEYDNRDVDWASCMAAC